MHSDLSPNCPGTSWQDSWMARCAPVTSQTQAWHAEEALGWPPDALVHGADSSEAASLKGITVDGTGATASDRVSRRLEK